MTPDAASITEQLAILDDPAGTRKTRLDHELTPAQRTSVYMWLEDREESYSTASTRIAREFGVKGISRLMLQKFHQTRRVAAAKRNLAQQAEATQEIVMAGSDAETVEDAVVAMLINRAMEVVNMPKITPSFYREVVGLVVRLREQKISMERLKLERARFELDVADLVMKHLDKLKASGALQVEDRSEAAKRIREELFGKYTKEQLSATSLASC
jgi:hypothetical protein